MCSAPVGRSPVSIRSEAGSVAICSSMASLRACAARKVSLTRSILSRGATGAAIGFCRVSKVPTIGVAIAIPEPWASELQDYRTSVGDTDGDADPHAHHAASRRPRWPTADLQAVCAHLTEAPRPPSRRSTSTCAAPARSARSRRSCSSPWPRGSRAARCSRAPYDRDRSRSTCDFPYHPHVTVAHHLDDQTLDQAFAELAEFECRFAVDAFSLYVHDADAGWRATDHFALG